MPVAVAEEPVKEPAKRGRPPGRKNRQGGGWKDAQRGKKTKPAAPARPATAPARAAAAVATVAPAAKCRTPSSNRSAAARAPALQVTPAPARLPLPVAVFRDLIVTQMYLAAGSPMPREWDGKAGLAANIRKALHAAGAPAVPRTVKAAMQRSWEADQEASSCAPPANDVGPTPVHRQPAAVSSAGTAPGRASGRLNASSLDQTMQAYCPDPDLARRLRETLPAADFQQISQVIESMADEVDSLQHHMRTLKSKKSALKDKMLKMKPVAGGPVLKDVNGHVTLAARDTIVDLITIQNVSNKQSIAAIETVAKTLFQVEMSEKDTVRNVTEQARHCMNERAEMLIMDQAIRMFSSISGRPVPSAAELAPPDDSWASIASVARPLNGSCGC